MIKLIELSDMVQMRQSHREREGTPGGPARARAIVRSTFAISRGRMNALRRLLACRDRGRHPRTSLFLELRSLDL